MVWQGVWRQSKVVFEWAHQRVYSRVQVGVMKQLLVLIGVFALAVFLVFAYLLPSGDQSGTQARQQSSIELTDIKSPGRR